MSATAGKRTATIALALLALFACREEEQHRVLGFEQGVYQGGDMPEIDSATREALQARAQRQDY